MTMQKIIIFRNQNGLKKTLEQQYEINLDSSSKKKKPAHNSAMTQLKQCKDAENPAVDPEKQEEKS